MKICFHCGKIDDNGRKFKDNFYCNRHYRQLLKNGEIKTTIFDKNPIIIKNDFAELFLYNKKLEYVGKAIIDIDDIDKVKNHKWFYSKGYATTHIDKKSVCMHNVIIGYDVDHINRNKLCNLKSNFRKINKSKNMMNSNLSIRNKSGVKGVSWNNTMNKWHVRICKDGNKINGGLYSDFNEAVKQRLIYESKLFGKYSYYYNNITNLLEITYNYLNEIKNIKITLQGEIINYG